MPVRAGAGPAAIVVGTGVVAALNFGKLPPALLALQAEFGLSLVQVSWMVSLFMFAGALFGIAGGAIADGFGPRRVMVAGLVAMGSASAAGAMASSPAVLFTSRAVESAGFLMAVLPGPALLRQCVPPSQLRGWLGAWAAYMPAGMGLALVATPWLMQAAGWRAAWWGTAIAGIGWAAMIAFALPRAPSGEAAGPGVAGGPTPADSPAAAAGRAPLAANAWATATRIGPWLLALCFLFYAGQFVGIFSFLPSVYADAGVAQSLGALLTALAVIANVAGNLASGLLLQRGFQRHALIAFAGVSMALCAWVAFGTDAPFALRYAAIVMLSVVGGLIPGTLFATAPFYAPNPAAVSTTVGLMQQGSASGQILLPPVIAALAQYNGGWSSTWLATGAAAACTVAIAAAIRDYDRKRLGRAVAAGARGGAA